MDDIDSASTRIIEEIQQGLRNLDEEEENLVLLRGQLSKVKRFREEQAKKDDIIITLKERIASLEYEKEFSQRQSAELEEIMSERILTLEQSLVERDEVEKQFLEFQVQAEIVEMDRDTLKSDLEAERRNHDQTRMECTELLNNVHRLAATIENDQQVAQKTKVLFDTLKSELQKKEQTLSTQTSSNKETVKQLTRELAVSRKAVEDMAEKLILLEEEKQSCQNTLHRTTAELGLARQDAAHQSSEVSRWGNMYNELEKVLSTLKAQTAMSQQSYAHEVATLQTDLAYHHKEHDRLRSELSAFSTTLTSIASDMSSIANTKAPATMNQIHHYRAEVVGALKSMKRYVSKLDESFVPNTMFKKIVSFVDDMTQTSLAYQEGLAESCSSNHVEVKKAATLEEQVGAMKRDLVYSDTAVEQLIQQFQTAGFLYSVDTTDLRAANRKSARIDSIGSEYRVKLYEELQLGVSSALRKVTDYTAAQDEWAQKDSAHHTELRECLETMRQLKEKYSTEIDHLHRMNEEALVAVRVAEYESGTEINRLREEYRTKLARETGGAAEQVQQLQALVDGSTAKHNQLSLSLEHLLAYVVPLQTQLASLSKAYSILKVLHINSEKVANGVVSLAQCCRPQSSGNPSEPRATYGKGKLRGEYIFEPFLDPLEEVSAPKTHTKVTFRVAVIYVLAALRFRNIMRTEKRSAQKVNTLLTAAARKDHTEEAQVGISLPTEQDLRAKSSVQIARQLIEAVKIATTEPGASARSPQQLRPEMSMDEFDAYLANYERNLDRRTSPNRSPASTRSAPQKKAGTSLFQALSPRHLRAHESARASNIYQLQNVSLLYKTLTDMSNREAESKASNEQLQMIVASLEEKLRSQEKHIARQDQVLGSARASEEKLLAQIDQMEKDKRSKSWHILKEIHEELRQDIGTGTHSVPARGHQSADGYTSSPVPTPPRRFPTAVPSAPGSAASHFSAGLDLTRDSPSPPPRVELTQDGIDLDLSAVNMTVPTLSPAPHPPAPMSAATATPAGVDQSGMSLYDSYEYTPSSVVVDTPQRASNAGVYASERVIDSMPKSEVFSPPVDISWDQNDSFNARFTGTDKGIHHHQSAHVHYDVRRSADTHHSHSHSHSFAHTYPSSDVSLGSRDGGAGPSYAHLPTASQVDYSHYDATVRRAQNALGQRSTTSAAYSVHTDNSRVPQRGAQAVPSNPLRRAIEERHAEDVQAIYSDIGRLSGRLESRLHKSASPEDFSRTTQHHNGYGYARNAQHK